MNQECCICDKRMTRKSFSEVEVLYFTEFCNAHAEQIAHGNGFAVETYMKEPDVFVFIVNMRNRQLEEEFELLMLKKLGELSTNIKDVNLFTDVISASEYDKSKIGMRITIAIF